MLLATQSSPSGRALRVLGALHVLQDPLEISGIQMVI